MLNKKDYSLNLGILGTVFAMVGIIASLWFGKFVKKRMFSEIVLASSVAALFSSGMFTWYTNEVTLLIYNFISATAISLLIQICDVNMYNLFNSDYVSPWVCIDWLFSSN